jgi:dinuclear metal center YbgI/SA1388 family protein
MQIDQIINYLENKFPTSFQESYDNSGQQIIISEEKISGIMLALDFTPLILEEMLVKKCNLLLTHHPFFFKPFRNIVSADPKSNLIIKSLEKKISLYALHTNLDKFYFSKLAAVFDFEPSEPLFLTEVLEDGQRIGLGSKVLLNKSISLQNFLAQVTTILNLDHLVYTGNLGQKIKKIAFLNGSGGNLIEKIIGENKDLDCILTGDVNYHHAQEASFFSVAVIDAGHFFTERIFLKFLKLELEDFFKKNKQTEKINLYLSETENNPFKLYLKEI